MTPWLRPLLTLTVLTVLTVLLTVSPLSLSYAAYAVDPSPGETLAGSAPGEGRARPGRDEPAPSVASSAPPRRPPKQPPTPVAIPSPAVKPPGKATAAADATRRTPAGPAFPGLRVLPLGSGLVLIGLGLGFFAVRMRRG
ncbi:hypothetical protein [Streptomyces sp. NPDC048436]|uniref:hypothetical protein n=1 Tax=Streptomyces sp. NPDC048436 TaxID=3365550 RepID=UPI00371CD5DF